MRYRCSTSPLGAALLVLAGGLTAAGADDKPAAKPVGVVKATVFLGEFD